MKKTAPILTYGFLVVFLLIGSTLFAQGKKGAGGKSASPTSSTPSDSSSGGGGGAIIEEEMVAYEAVSALADQIVTMAATTIPEHNKQTDPPLSCQSTNKILIVDPVAQSEIAAFYSFKTLITALKTAYTSLGPNASGPLAVSPTDWISAGVSVITALRNTAVFSGQTFQPDDTVLISLLTKKFAEKEFYEKGPHYAIVTAQIPGDMTKASADVGTLLKGVSDARARVTADNQKTDFFKALDQQWAGLQTSLTSADASGNMLLSTVISGQAIASSLGTCYCQLFAKTIATGGSSRTNHNFFVELFYTTPKPSYNGGAIVSFSLLAGDGTYLTGDTLRLVYDYSKWGPPKVEGYKNFGDKKK